MASLFFEDPGLLGKPLGRLEHKHPMAWLAHRSGGYAVNGLELQVEAHRPAFLEFGLAPRDFRASNRSSKEPKSPRFSNLGVPSPTLRMLTEAGAMLIRS